MGAGTFWVRYVTVSNLNLETTALALDGGQNRADIADRIMCSVYVRTGYGWVVPVCVQPSLPVFSTSILGGLTYLHNTRLAACRLPRSSRECVLPGLID